MYDFDFEFDLTRFKNVEAFESILKKYNLTEYVRLKQNFGAGDIHEFIWKNDKLKLKTSNNPITGEHSSGFRELEKGYASYIEISGDEKQVELVKKDIRINAEYIKGEKE